jgi:ribonuclease-3
MVDNQNDDTPYNNKNILIDEGNINNILKKYGIRMKCINIDIYRNALVHKSYSTRKNDNFLSGNINCPENCLPLQEVCNERYEFLGDSVLSTTVANYLYMRYPDQNEGFLTKMRSKLVNGRMLSELSKKVGLQKWMIISKQIEDNDGRKNYKILEDIFEAFICAIFLDFNKKTIKGNKLEGISGLGFQIAERWIINIIENEIDLADLIIQNKNYKDTLIKYFQHNYMKMPNFFEANVEMINNKKFFTIIVKNNEQILGTGKADTKKQAEQFASQEALTYFNEI